MIEENVRAILQEIAAGNNLGEKITLVGASKTVSPENINLAVDQRGFKRASTTCVGSYDADATSGIADVIAADRLSVCTLGNGLFSVNGARAEATVYNLSGNVVKVVPANDVIDLSSLAKGVYIIHVDGEAFKVIK